MSFNTLEDYQSLHRKANPVRSKLQDILTKQREHWDDVTSELVDGKKKTHWCWYFLPNVPGLGTSDQAKAFAVTPGEFVEFMKNSEYAGNINTVTFLIYHSVRHLRTHFNEDFNVAILKVLGHNSVDVLKYISFITLVRSLVNTKMVTFKSDRINIMFSDLDGMFPNAICEHTEDVLEDFYRSRGML